MGDYDPYQHRDRKNPTTNLESLFHTVKGILGTGIMALPEAFYYTGFLLGSVLLTILTIIVTYSIHISFRCMYELCKKNKVPQLTYPQAVKEAFLIGPEFLKKFANSAPYIVNGFILFYQIGSCCVYYIFIVSNCKQVIDHNTSKKSHIGVEVYMVMLLLPLLAITFIKNLKILAPFSYLGNFVTFAGLICIYYYIFRSIEPIEDRRLFGKIQHLPLFMGTAMFSCVAYGVMLSIEMNMKSPQDWGGYFGVLNQGVFLVFILNFITGFCGYWKYGDKTESSITLNLSIDEKLTWAVRILFSIAIFFSYALQCYPATEILWEQYTEKFMETSKHKLIWEYVIRTIVVLSTFLFSIAIPRLGLFISLVGAVCICMLCIILPPIMEICIHWPDDFGKYDWIFWKNIALIVFGILGFIAGMYSNIYEIVLSFLN